MAFAVIATCYKCGIQFHTTIPSGSGIPYKLCLECDKEQFKSKEKKRQKAEDSHIYRLCKKTIEERIERIERLLYQQRKRSVPHHTHRTPRF